MTTHDPSLTKARAAKTPGPGFIRRLAEKFERFFFGDDVFISYSRRDGADYALALAGGLTKHGLSCYLDQYGSPPGRELPQKLKRSLRRSSMLVLVGTPGAAESEHVWREVEEFMQARRGAPLLPITFVPPGSYALLRGAKAPPELKGSLEAATWYDALVGAARSVESTEALEKNAPSDKVVERVVNAENFTSRNKRLRRIFAATLVGLVLVLAAAGTYAKVLIGEAQAQAADAERKREESEKLARQADEARKNSERQAQAAEEARAASEKLKEEADKKAAAAQGELKDAQAELGTAQESLSRTKTDLDKQTVLLGEQRVKTEATGVALGVGQSRERVLASELDLVWSLAGNTAEVRDTFVAQMLESPANALRFSNRPAMLTHAAVGLSPGGGEATLGRHVLPCLRDSSRPAAVRLACAELGAQTGIREREFAALALPLLAAAVAEGDDSSRLEGRAAELRFVVGQLEGEPVRLAFEEVVGAVERGRRFTAPGDRAAVEAVTRRYASSAPGAALERLLAAVEALPAGGEDPQALHFWVNALTQAPAELSPEQRKSLLAKLIESCKRHWNEPKQNFEMRGETLRLAMTKVAEADAPNAADQLLDEFNEAGYGYIADRLAAGVGALTPRLDAAASVRVLNRMVEHFISARYFYHLKYLFPVVEELARKATPEGKNAAAARLSAALLGPPAPRPAGEEQLPDTQSDGFFFTRAKLLRDVTDSLPPDEGERLLAKAVDFIKRDRPNSDYDLEWTAGLKVVASLAPPQAARRLLLTALEGTDREHAYAVGFLANALGSVREIPPDELRAAFRMAMAGGARGGIYDLALKDGLVSLARRVDSPEEAAVCDDLADAMSRVQFPIHLDYRAFGAALAAVPEPRCDAARERALQLVGARPPEPRLVQSGEVADWVLTMRGLSGRLSAQTAKAAMSSLLSKYLNAAGDKGEGVPVWRDAFAVVVEKSDPRDVPALVSQITEEFKEVGAPPKPKVKATPTPEPKADATPEVKAEEKAEGDGKSKPPASTVSAPPAFDFDDFEFDIPKTEAEVLKARNVLAQYLAALPCELPQADLLPVWKTLFDAAGRGGEFTAGAREGLLALSGRIPPSEAPAYVELLLSAADREQRDEVRALYNELLPPLAQRTAPEHAGRVFQRMAASAARSTDPGLPAAVASALENLPGKVEAGTLVEFLKWPVSVGPLRSAVIRRLGRQERQDYGDDLWAVAAWARGAGIDTSGPPNRPPT